MFAQDIIEFFNDSIHFPRFVEWWENLQLREQNGIELDLNIVISDELNRDGCVFMTEDEYQEEIDNATGNGRIEGYQMGCNEMIEKVKKFASNMKAFKHKNAS